MYASDRRSGKIWFAIYMTRTRRRSISMVTCRDRDRDANFPSRRANEWAKRMLSPICMLSRSIICTRHARRRPSITAQLIGQPGSWSYMKRILDRSLHLCPAAIFMDRNNAWRRAFFVLWLMHSWCYLAWPSEWWTTHWSELMHYFVRSSTCVMRCVKQTDWDKDLIRVGRRTVILLSFILLISN